MILIVKLLLCGFRFVLCSFARVLFENGNEKSVSLIFLYILFCFYILGLWPSRSETEAHKTFAAASFAFFMQCRRSQVNAFLALIVQLYCLSGINCSCSCIVWSSLRFGFGRDAYRWSQNRMEVLYNPKSLGDTSILPTSFRWILLKSRFVCLVRG